MKTITKKLKTMIEITLYREDLIVKTLDIGLINSANFNIPYEEWLKADKITYVDDDGCCLVLKERDMKTITKNLITL